MPEINPEALQAYQNRRDTADKSIICHAPFTNINFEQGGYATACCYNRKHVLGVWPNQNIKQMWFGPKAKELRDYIKNLNFNHGCELCCEQINSYNFSNSRLKWYDEYAQNQTWQNKLKKKLNFKSAIYPACFEFEIDNVCNLECVMCNGKFSNLIRKNREKLPPLHNPYNEDFVKEVSEYLPYLKEAKFLGGEPFLTPLYYQIWENILKINPSIKVFITTNATVLTQKVKNLLNQLNAYIIVSIDSINPETYGKIRLNANFEKVMDNLNYFIDYSVKHNRPLALAVCPMTLNYLEIPEIVNFCNKNNIQIGFNTVDRPYKLSLMALNTDEITEAERVYANYIADPKISFVHQNKEVTEGLFNYVKSLKQISQKNLAIVHQLKQLNQALQKEPLFNRFLNVFYETQYQNFFHQTSDEFENMVESAKTEVFKFIENNGFEETFNIWKNIISASFPMVPGVKKTPPEIEESLDVLFQFIQQNPQQQNEIFWGVLNIKITQLIEGIEFTDKNSITMLLTKEFTRQ